MFCIIRVSELSVQPLPNITPDNGEYTVYIHIYICHIFFSLSLLSRELPQCIIIILRVLGNVNIVCLSK
jgi:hypothetical protein